MLATLCVCVGAVACLEPRVCSAPWAWVRALGGRVEEGAGERWGVGGIGDVFIGMVLEEADQVHRRFQRVSLAGDMCSGGVGVSPGNNVVGQGTHVRRGRRLFNLGI